MKNTIIEHTNLQASLNDSFQDLMNANMQHLNATWAQALRMANGQIRSDYLRATKTTRNHESILSQKEDEMERLRNDYLVSCNKYKN